MTPIPTSIPRSFINPGDQAAKDRLAQLPVFVPAAELDKAKQEAAAAKAAQAAELKAEQTKAEQYRSRVPRLVALRLHVGREEGQRTRPPANLAGRQVHLSARRQFQETPALYEVEGQESRRSSTSISTLVSIPCRSCWRTGISPSASRRLNSIAWEVRSSHDRSRIPIRPQPFPSSRKRSRRSGKVCRW